MPGKKTPSVRRGAKRLAAYPTIEDESDVRRGVRALRRGCEVMRRVHDAAGDPPLRRHEAGFVGLSRVVVGQQLSIASADAIWRRTEAAVAPFDPPTLLAVSEADLRAAGLSGGKIATLRAVATAVNGGLDLGGFSATPEAEVHDALTAIHGIGPWTADIYLMFCMGRADAWASGDLGLALGAQRAFGLAARPSLAELTALAERWRPWRAVAARLLWAYYAAERRTKLAQPV